MPVYRIPEEHVFPDPAVADPSGLVGVGGDLHPRRLLLAYACGIFPWYSEGEPILWWSPDPRTVLYTSELHVSRSVAKRVRNAGFRITLDTAFEAVIAGCAEARRPAQKGTWITGDMAEAYVRLHALGVAHSCEAWRGDRLVGGLYGVAVGRLFSGESMFAREDDASKVAFVHLARQLEVWGFPLVDCQMRTGHLARFGAKEIPRARYVREIRDLVRSPGRVGKWVFDQGFICTGQK